MKGIIGKLYYNPTLAKIFHTLVSCLQSELSDCETVLDLGCGPDSPLQYCRNVKYSVGVEAFKPYLLQSKKRKIHTRYLGKRIEDLAFPRKSFDAVIMIEVLEHLPKNLGEKILKKTSEWAKKKVVVSTPNGYFPMDNVDKNSWQKHQSGWTVGDLEKRGFVCHGLAGMKFFYSGESQVESMVTEAEDNLYANLRFRPKKLFYMLNSLLQTVSYYIPGLGFELFAVKTLPDKR